MSVKATEQKQDSARQYTNLDNRYGKIGISAVAAAVRHQGASSATQSRPISSLTIATSGSRAGCGVTYGPASAIPSPPRPVTRPLSLPCHRYLYLAQIRAIGS